MLDTAFFAFENDETFFPSLDPLAVDGPEEIQEKINFIDDWLETLS